MNAIVLAGERPGGSSLAAAMGAPAAVLTNVAGKPSIARVIETLRIANGIDGGLIAGPAAELCQGANAAQAMRNILAVGDYSWIEPDRGPAESTLRALNELDSHPVLVTTGDHALLAPATVESFVSAAVAADAQAVVGLVPHQAVMQRFPGSRRTRLRFREGSYCGANLFLLRSPEAANAIRFWQKVQSDRKQPWRIAKQLGTGTLLRYLSGRLPIANAFATLSRLSRCAIGWVEIDDELAAVDVDTLQDLALAERVLAARGDSPASHLPASHREETEEWAKTGTRPTRREKREYRKNLSDEQRRQAGCISVRQQPDFCRGLPQC